MKRSINVLRLALLLVSALVTSAVGAQQYPTHPVRLISPYPAGGGNDTLARIIADKLGDQLGQRVIVDNRPGANTIVGTEMLAKSAPDGHMLILLPNSFATNPALYSKLPYDTLKDFAPIAQIAVSPQILVAHPSLPVRTLKDLLALAKAKPGYLIYGSSGNGSTGHLAGLLFNMMAHVRLEHVGYKGAAPAVIDVMGGHIPLVITSMLATMPHLSRLRALGVTSTQRAKALPDVPTISEAGVPGYEATLWYGILAASRTPDAIVKRLNASLAAVMKDPEVMEKLSTQAVEAYHSSPDQFATLIRSELAKWTKVISASGVKVD